MAAVGFAILRTSSAFCFTLAPMGKSVIFGGPRRLALGLVAQTLAARLKRGKGLPLVGDVAALIAVSGKRSPGMPSSPFQPASARSSSFAASASGSLVVAMLVHVVIDLRLLLMPGMHAGVEGSSG